MADPLRLAHVDDRVLEKIIHKFSDKKLARLQQTTVWIQEFIRERVVVATVGDIHIRPTIVKERPGWIICSKTQEFLYFEGSEGLFREMFAEGRGSLLFQQLIVEADEEGIKILNCHQVQLSCFLRQIALSLAQAKVKFVTVRLFMVPPVEELFTAIKPSTAVVFSGRRKFPDFWKYSQNLSQLRYLTLNYANSVSLKPLFSGFFDQVQAINVYATLISTDSKSAAEGLQLAQSFKNYILRCHSLKLSTYLRVSSVIGTGSQAVYKTPESLISSNEMESRTVFENSRECWKFFMLPEKEKLDGATVVLLCYIKSENLPYLLISRHCRSFKQFQMFLTPERRTLDKDEKQEALDRVKNEIGQQYFLIL